MTLNLITVSEETTKDERKGTWMSLGIEPVTFSEELEMHQKHGKVEGQVPQEIIE